MTGRPTAETTYEDGSAPGLIVLLAGTPDAGRASVAGFDVARPERGADHATSSWSF